MPPLTDAAGDAIIRLNEALRTRKLDQIRADPFKVQFVFEGGSQVTIEVHGPEGVSLTIHGEVLTLIHKVELR